MLYKTILVATSLTLATNAHADLMKTMTWLDASSANHQAHKANKQLSLMSAESRAFRSLTCDLQDTLPWFDKINPNRDITKNSAYQRMETCKHNFEVLFPEYRVGEIISFSISGDGYAIFEIVKRTEDKE